MNKVDDDRYWRGFRRGDWCHSIAVRDFVVRNVSPYEGDETFLVGSSRRTRAVWEKLQSYFQEEQKKAHKRGGSALTERFLSEGCEVF